MRVHFGIGAATKIESLEIHWPSGTIDTVKNLEADKFYSVLEGSGVVDAKALKPKVPAAAAAK
jgi:hypothetical protein